MSTSRKSVWLARAFYRRCLHLLPRRFYSEYAQQMALDFDDLLQDTARQRGPLLVARTLLLAVGDVLLSAVREHVALLRGDLEVGTVTPCANAAIAIAHSHAEHSGGISADGRLLLGLAAEQHGLAGTVMREFGVHADRLRQSIRESAAAADHTAKVGEPADMGPSAAFRRQLTSAANCARSFGHDYIGTEHLALSILGDAHGGAARMIERLGVDPNSLCDALAERTRSLTRARPRRRPSLVKWVAMLLLFVAFALLAGAALLSTADETGLDTSRCEGENTRKSPREAATSEIAIQRKEGEALLGTLFVPESRGRAPAILVIPGAGQFDSEASREAGSGAATGEALGEFLARQGFAVLCSRQGGGATGNAEERTLEQLAEDALLWIDFLQAHERVNPDRVGVLGQSAGGLVAMAAAASSKKVSFLVTTATPMMSIDSLAKELLGDLLRSTGADETERASVVAAFDSVMSAIAEGKTTDEIRPQLVAVLSQVYQRLPEQQRARSGESFTKLVETAADHQLKTFGSPWFRSLVGRDPAKLLGETTCPVLVLYAGQDVKVSADRNSELARAALKARKPGSSEVRTIEDAPHSFEVDAADSKSRSVSFSSRFLEVLSDWLRDR